MKEEVIQADCVVWFKNTFPQYRDLFYMNCNDGKKNLIAASKDKAKGLTAGIPDTFLAVPTTKGHGCYFEFKTAKGNLTPAQERVIPQLRERGYAVEVVRSLEEFQLLVKLYLDEQ